MKTTARFLVALTFTGNVFKNCNASNDGAGATALSLNDTTYSTASSNQISDSNSYTTYGIQEAGSSDYNVFGPNSITGITGGILGNYVYAIGAHSTSIGRAANIFAAAISGGLSAGDVYRTNGDPDTLCIVH